LRRDTRSTVAFTASSRASCTAQRVGGSIRIREQQKTAPRPLVIRIVMVRVAHRLPVELPQYVLHAAAVQVLAHEAHHQRFHLQLLVFIIFSHFGCRLRPWQRCLRTWSRP
jgi:hypothetical protein